MRLTSTRRLPPQHNYNARKQYPRRRRGTGARGDTNETKDQTSRDIIAILPPQADQLKKSITPPLHPHTHSTSTTFASRGLETVSLFIVQKPRPTTTHGKRQDFPKIGGTGTQAPISSRTHALWLLRDGFHDQKYLHDSSSPWFPGPGILLQLP